MEKTKSCKKIIETNSRKFILYSKNSNKNLNLILGNIPKIIILLKNYYYRNIWNSCANSLVEIFLLLSYDENQKWY
jgi:hypothetical protein